MSNNDDYSWFNEKADSNGLTYEDKRRLFKQFFKGLGIRFSDRDKRRLEDELVQQIFLLKSRKTESAHVIAHSLLTCFSSLMDVDEAKYEKYREDYAKAIRGHEGTSRFKHNYILPK